MIPSRFRSDTSKIVFDGVGLSVHRLATELELDPSYLFRVFRGDRECSRKYARMLAARLHMTTDHFLSLLDVLHETIPQTIDQTTPATRETLGY